MNAFAASALLVHYLLDQQGSLEPFWDLWRLARTELEAAPQRIYGRTWRELDADFRSFFGIDAPAPRAGGTAGLLRLPIAQPRS